MSGLGRAKAQQALSHLSEDALWLFITREGSDPASKLIFDAAVSGNAAFMLHPNHKILALTANYDQGHLARLGVFDEIRAYEKSFNASLKTWLKELLPKTMLLNYSETDHLSDGLTHGQFLSIQRLIEETLPQVRIQSSEGILSRVRGVKTAEELERLQTAIQGSMDLYERLLPQLSIGQSERDIQALMLTIAQELGFQAHLGDYGGPLVCINRVGLAHRAPGDDQVEAGDLLILDHALEYQGYHSDVARTVYFRREGEASVPDEVESAFASAFEAITAAYEAIMPGKQGWEVDHAARQIHLKNGFPEITHATGHQIGRHVHDGGSILGPPWDRYGKAPYLELEAGNVFTIEPTILQSPHPSMLVEENVVITEEGAKWLSKRQEQIWVV